uniref:sphingomyelin phosphodiesterase 5 n=1 Tax=Ciona intestinalis TaxID=7719 RepID=UPI000180C321|nr:sphingomyelin phosphodiesterase 5 [Ciona intestinalis]|eukprot:XP_002128155.1 sphingomyelin phosphodiesterase 5 [Ciona intestinalis]
MDLTKTTRKRTTHIHKMSETNEAETSAYMADSTTKPHLMPGGPYTSSNFIVQCLYKISTVCLTPWSHILDRLLAMFIRTSETSRGSILSFCIKAFLLLIVLLCLTPIAIFAFIIWFPLQWFRPRSFSYISPHTEKESSSSGKYERVFLSNRLSPSVSSITSAPQSARGAQTFSVMSANLCLMPEFIAHINNLTNSVTRGKKMAAFFCGEPVPRAKVNQGVGEGVSKPTETDFLVATLSTESVSTGGREYEPIAGENIDSRSITSAQWSITSKERTVSENFSFIADFLCLQEVFDGRSTNQLIQGLKRKYPYIIYDVSQPLHNCRMTLLGSGLCIASLHPFIDISFKPYPDGHNDDKLACKGLLMTKVFLGKDDRGHDLVGYLATTHLQAWSHSHASTVRCKQLDSIYSWMEEFKLNSATRDGNTSEKVLFNVITGDFNFDKASYYDLNEQRCQFLQQFIDPCIDEQSGGQHSWVVGTELNQTRMHEDRVKTPRGLQRMLVSELERCRYVASTTPTKNSLQKPQDGKRKIDYILYEECPNINTDIKDFKFFTGLATLTDHLPVGMVFSCHDI